MSSAPLILGIESSCDETAAAVVVGPRRVLSSVVASQHDLHAEYHGVVPEIASRAHAQRLLPTVRRALADSRVTLDQLDAIAVGNRPGLIGSLLVGLAGAKALALALGKPLIPVDHVHAHLTAGYLSRDGGNSSADSDALPAHFPAIGLVVSGGHTALFRLDSPTQLRRLGGTIDDAVGEAFDKAAAILGLPFPGGPALDKLAQSGNDRALHLPIARVRTSPLDCSFSGLKTAVLYAVQGVPTHPARAARASTLPSPAHVPPEPRDVAASFQRAAVAALTDRLALALDRHPDARAILVGGGVSANSRLRTQLTSLAANRRLPLVIPAMEFCLDNAAMVAGHAALLLTRNARLTLNDLALPAFPTTAV